MWFFKRDPLRGIPKAWSQVPLSRLDAIKAYQENPSTDPLEDMVARVSLVSSVDVGIEHVGAAAVRLSFLDLPPQPTDSGFVWCRGVKYVRPAVLDRMTIGQFADMMLNSGDAQTASERLATTLASVFVRDRGVSTYRERLAEFTEHLDVDQAFSRFSVIDVWTQSITERFGILFREPASSPSIDSKRRGGRGAAAAARKLALENARWSWYGMIDGLAASDPLRFVEASNLNVIQALRFLSYHERERQLKEKK